MQCVHCLPVLSYRAADNAQCCLYVLYNSCRKVWLNFWFAVRYTLLVWVPQELSGCMLIFHNEISERNLFAEHDIICGFNEIWSHSLTLCLKCFMGLSCCGDILIFQFLFWIIFITWSASATGFKKKVFDVPKCASFTTASSAEKKNDEMLFRHLIHWQLIIILQGFWVFIQQW